MKLEAKLKHEECMCSPNNESKACRSRLFVLCPQMLLIWLIAQAMGFLSLAAGQDWPQWRGPNRDGVAERMNLPDRLSENLQFVWKVEVGEGYSAPVVVESKVVLFVRQREKEVVLCLNAQNGREMWRYSYAAPYTPRADARPHGKVPFTTPYDMNTITPVFHDGMIIYSGYRKGTTAVRLVKAGDGTSAGPAWHRERFSMYMSSPVIRGEYMYSLSQQRAAISCIALKDGEHKWNSAGGLGQYVSIVGAGDKLLVLTTKGRLMLVAADPSGYKELGRTHVTDKPVWAHLVLAANRIYVKDKAHLVCFELPAQVGNKSESSNYRSLQDNERGD